MKCNDIQTNHVDRQTINLSSIVRSGIFQILRVLLWRSTVFYSNHNNAPIGKNVNAPLILIYDTKSNPRVPTPITIGIHCELTATPQSLDIRIIQL